MLRERSEILVPVLSGVELDDALRDPRGRTAIVKSLEGIYGWEGNPHHLIDGKEMFPIIKQLNTKVKTMAVPTRY